MSDPIIRAYVARVEVVSPQRRSFKARINTSGVDRYRTVIDPKGIRLANYMENRVVLWEHGNDPQRGAMPVGRNEWIKPAIGPNGLELIAQTQLFDGKKSDEFIDRLWACYKDGDMRGVSVNVVPDEDSTSPPTHDEIRERPELKQCTMMYRKSELAEYSLVACPGNADALTIDDARSLLRCVKRGLAFPADFVQRAEKLTEEDELLDAELSRYITHDKSKGKWIVHAEDGSVLGEHSSKSDAVKQLQAIEAHKHKDRTEPVLPPLGGRSYAEYREHVLSQIRGLFDPVKLAEDLKARADLARGRV